MSRLFSIGGIKFSPSRIKRRFLHEKAWNTSVPIFTEASIKNQLEELSVPYRDGYTCLHVKDCLCCKNLSNVKDGSEIFINKRTGFFLCESCKATGDWADYSILLSKVKNEKVDVNSYKKYWRRYDVDHSGWNEVVRNAEPLQVSSDKESNILQKFKLPKFTQVVSNKLGIRISKDKNVLYFPLYCLTSPVVGYKTYDAEGRENTFPRVDCPGFLVHSVSPRSAAVVVSSISDFLALISLNLHTYDIICLQYGATHLPQSSLPFFERYNRIVLWLGEANLDATGTVARKLVEKRCYVVRPTQNQKSPSVAVSKNESILEILSNAKLTWHQYVTSFGSLREEILAELQNNYQAAGIPWKKYPALTKLLKGHRRGELTILTGPTGVGKTTFLSEYSLDLAMQGVNTLWGSFEIKNTRLAKILLTQYNEGPIPENAMEYNSLCDKFEELPMFFLTFHGQQSLPSVLEAVKHCAYTYDIAHVIIDNVQFMIEVSPDVNQLDRFLKQDIMIQAFRSFASKFNCHVTLVMHPRKVDSGDLNVNSIFGGAKASQEADNVLIIQKKDLNTFGVKKYLQVSKNRYSGDLGLFPLYFDKSSLSFSKPIDFSRSPTQQNSVCVSQPEPWNENDEMDEWQSQA